jgi:hypothetical protein
MCPKLDFVVQTPRKPPTNKNLRCSCRTRSRTPCHPPQDSSTELRTQSLERGEVGPIVDELGVGAVCTGGIFCWLKGIVGEGGGVVSK